MVVCCLWVVVLRIISALLNYVSGIKSHGTCVGSANLHNII